MSYGISLSRTNLVCSFIIIMATLGFFDNTKRLLLYIFFAALILYFFSENVMINQNEITFFGKILNSINEVALNDGSNPSEMLINWRGFEAYRAFVGFMESNFFNQLFGGGFGALVDLGFTVEISKEMNYEFLPILHNGYFHTLVKYGVVGLFCYAIFLKRIIIQNKKIVQI